MGVFHSENFNIDLTEQPIVRGNEIKIFLSFMGSKPNKINKYR